MFAVMKRKQQNGVLQSRLYVTAFVHTCIIIDVYLYNSIRFT